MEEELYPAGVKGYGAFTKKELVKLCQQNPWLKRGGEGFEPGGLFGVEGELDYIYTFLRYSDVEKLKKFFTVGNWAIRQGVIYKRLCFINQVNAGDEWWTIKKFEDGRLLPFESITWRHFIEDGEFEEEITKYLNATYEQCRNLSFWRILCQLRTQSIESNPVNGSSR